MTESYQLKRFVDAQDRNGTYDQAVSELRVGQKVGHWMWYIFPQIAGLGHSPMSRMFAISSLAEAQAYVQRIEELVGVPVCWVSNGPRREQLITRQPELRRQRPLRAVGT